MIIRKLNDGDVNDFCELIVDMYSHLEDLEWFSPMPYDEENIRKLLNNPRFYVVGAFENNKLLGVSSLDYKCGKLIGKIQFPKDCDTNKLVEFGFSMVNSDYRGKGIIKELVEHLYNKIKNDGYEWAFAKAHINNTPSNRALIKNDFKFLCSYLKPVNKQDFISLSSQDFFSERGKENAKKTLEKFKDCDEINVCYNIVIKKL